MFPTNFRSRFQRSFRGQPQAFSFNRQPQPKFQPQLFGTANAMRDGGEMANPMNGNVGMAPATVTSSAPAGLPSNPQTTPQFSKGTAPKGPQAVGQPSAIGSPSLQGGSALGQQSSMGTQGLGAGTYGSLPPVVNPTEGMIFATDMVQTPDGMMDRRRAYARNLLPGQQAPVGPVSSPPVAAPPATNNSGTTFNPNAVHSMSPESLALGWAASEGMIPASMASTPPAQPQMSSATAAAIARANGGRMPAFAGGAPGSMGAGAMPMNYGGLL